MEDTSVDICANWIQVKAIASSCWLLLTLRIIHAEYFVDKMNKIQQNEMNSSASVQLDKKSLHQVINIFYVYSRRFGHGPSKVTSNGSQVKHES